MLPLALLTKNAPGSPLAISAGAYQWYMMFDYYVLGVGPNSYAKCHIEPEGPGRYVFSYVPLEVGMFTVMLKWNNRELASSPYRVRVCLHSG